MKETKRKRTPKIKIEQIELSTFSYKELTIDPYWDDLYNPEPKNKKTYKIIK